MNTELAPAPRRRVPSDHPAAVLLRRHRTAVIAYDARDRSVEEAETAELYSFLEGTDRTEPLSEAEWARYDDLRHREAERFELSDRMTARTIRLVNRLLANVRKRMWATPPALEELTDEPPPVVVTGHRDETRPPRTCLHRSPLSTCHASVAPPREPVSLPLLANAHGNSHPPPD